jgi:hypothetical protein
MLTQMYLRGRVFLVLAFLAVTVATALWGQAVDGAISGTLTDPSGAAIAGATVQVRNTATQVLRTVTTNTPGRYWDAAVALGTFRICRASGRDVSRVA